MPQNPPEVRVAFSLPDAERRRLKAAAALNGETINDILRRAVGQYLDEASPESSVRELAEVAQ